MHAVFLEAEQRFVSLLQVVLLDAAHDGDEGRVAQQLAGVLTRGVGDAADHALVVDPRVLDGRDR